MIESSTAPGFELAEYLQPGFIGLCVLTYWMQHCRRQGKLSKPPIDELILILFGTGSFVIGVSVFLGGLGLTSFIPPEGAARNINFVVAGSLTVWAAWDTVAAALRGGLKEAQESAERS